MEREKVCARARACVCVCFFFLYVRTHVRMYVYVHVGHTKGRQCVFMFGKISLPYMILCEE